MDEDKREKVRDAITNAEIWQKIVDADPMRAKEFGRAFVSALSGQSPVVQFEPSDDTVLNLTHADKRFLKSLKIAV